MTCTMSSFSSTRSTPNISNHFQTIREAMLNIKGCRETNAFGNEGAAASGYEGYGAVDNLSDGLNRSDRPGGDRLPDDIAESAEGGEFGNGHASGTSGAGAGAGGESVRFSSKSDGLKSERIDVNIGDGEGGYECLCEIPLTAVVFQQGINEYQAVANTGIAGNKEFQHTVNDESLERLRVYYARYRTAAESQALTKHDKHNVKKEVPSWQTLMTSIENAVKRRMKTNVHLILHTTDLCRQLSGVHCICCKSGKDRTSMGVTLEEARHLCDHMSVVGGRKACKTIRRFGGRRSNGESG